jgi:hypothetical protein
MCGVILDDNGYPNSVEHLLISTQVQERLQDLVDLEVRHDGDVHMWPEHWEAAKPVVLWKCFACARFYVDADGDNAKVVVYNIERIGIEPF